jgi:hypothetical protein
MRINFKALNYEWVFCVELLATANEEKTYSRNASYQAPESIRKEKSYFHSFSLQVSL